MNAKNQARIKELNEQIKNARQAQWNASKMNRSRAVFECEGILTRLYREKDRLLRES